MKMFKYKILKYGKCKYCFETETVEQIRTNDNESMKIICPNCLRELYVYPKLREEREEMRKAWSEDPETIMECSKCRKSWKLGESKNCPGCGN